VQVRHRAKIIIVGVEIFGNSPCEHLLSRHTNSSSSSLTTEY
jgi:hypothetical protein